MSGRRRRAALALAVVAGCLVVAATVLLLSAAVAEKRRAPVDAALVAALEARARLHAGAAAALAAERLRQTESSLVREASNRRLGWVLLAASSAFVTTGKWLLARPACPSGDARRAPAPGPGAPGRPRRAGAGARRPPPDGAAERAEPDLGVVDDLVARWGRGSEAAIPILQAIQARFGYLPDAVLERLCERTAITPVQLAGAATFYARFRRAPVGERVVRVCHGTACHVAGASRITDELRRRLAIPKGADTDPERRFTLDPVACLGCCSLAPVMRVGEETAGRLTPASAWRALALEAR